MPNGTVIREELEKLAKEQEFLDGYERVSTPHITRENLYHTSGHLPYYADSMFPPMEVDGKNVPQTDELSPSPPDLSLPAKKLP